MIKFNKYSRHGAGPKVCFTFVPNITLPSNYQISTPMNFVYVGSELLLCFDKNNCWNPVCGKIESGESWEDALRRETQEEVGATVKNLYVVGYVFCENEPDSIFPLNTIFPVCYSFADTINTDWISKETSKRNLFSHNNAIKEFRKINDGGHLVQIYEYVHSVWKKDISYEYSYIRDRLLPDIVTTSAMTFCVNKDKNFCVVRDVGEDFLSLPGGGCNLGEDAFLCAARELLEEAIIYPKNMSVLGTILIEFKKDGNIVSKMQQARFLCEIDDIKEFHAHANEFETDLRLFLDFNDLSTQVRQLQNDTGDQILSHLREKMSL